MYSKEEAQEIRHAFWHKLESKTRRIPGQNGKPIHWMMDRTGVKGLDMRFDMTGGHVIVAMEINSHSQEKDEALWAKLENCRKLIEAHFETDVYWNKEYQREAGNIVARVYVMRDGDIYNKEMWPDMIHFMIDNMLRMQAAFLEIQDYMIHF